MELLKRTMLVTGACGFIGSAFVRKAIDQGHRVVVLDSLTYAGHRVNLEGLPQDRCELVEGDICNGPLVARLLKERAIGSVINFAAESHVDRSIDSPGAFIKTNIEGVYTLLNASLMHWQTLDSSAKAQFRFLQVSTDEVYGALGETGFFSEKTPMAPNSPYSASKASGDLLVRAWFHTYGLPVLTTNCSNNYGPRQFPEKLIPLMITHALTGKPLPVYGQGGNIRDWIHVEDHCDGILLALTRGKPGETYCFGGNAERRNLEVVKQLCATMDKLSPRADGKAHDTAITFVKDRLGHDWRYAIDDSKAQRELGFKRRYTFESGLEQTVRWYLENGRWVEAVMPNLLRDKK